MQKKLITLKHHVHDYECMWNGIEDLYIEETGEKLPPNFFFGLGSFGSFCYMKTPKSKIKRLVAFGDARTKQMYKFLSPIVGFEYRHYQYNKFQQVLKKAKAEIDGGYPVVLGAMDMYYLPYYSKLYHKAHIPFHYVLMVGYDDEAQCIYLLDCGREEVLVLSYHELGEALNCSYEGLSKPNTICTIRMNTTKDKYSIAKEALAAKGKGFLNPPVGFLGRRGFEKFIHELPKMKTELTKEEYHGVLKNIVMFFGTVPTIPNVLIGITEPDQVSYHGGFDKMSRILFEMGGEYGNNQWIETARQFNQGAVLISEITDIILDYLTEQEDNMKELPKLFTMVMDIVTDGFVNLMN